MSTRTGGTDERQPSFGFSGDPGDQNNPNQGPGGSDMSQLGAMLQQLGAMPQSGGNEVSRPVDWDLAHNLARQSISQKGDPSVNDNDVRRIGEAFDLAQVWLTPRRCPRRWLSGPGHVES